MNIDNMTDIQKMIKPVRHSVFDRMEEVDWVYSMRREMQEIIPGLWLGPYSSAVRTKLDCLDEIGITHIICIRQEIEAHLIRPNFPHKIKYLVLDIADSVTENIIRFLPRAKKFIDDCLESGGKILVHGNLGVSRSGSLVIAYIMETKCLSYEHARSFVQERRFCVNPNDGFADQLREYEPIYKANQTLENGQTSQETGKLKRKYDTDEADKYLMDCVN